MQESFPQHVLPIKTKLSYLGGYFSRKIKSLKKRSKNRKFDFSEGHNFLCEKIKA